MISKDEDEDSFKGDIIPLPKHDANQLPCRNHSDVYRLAEEVRRLSNWYLCMAMVGFTDFAHSIPM